MPDIWGQAAIITKAALYLGVLTAVGVVIVALAFRLERYRGVALIFAVLGLVAAALSFLLSGANLTGDASGMTDPEMLGLLWTTSVGTALLFRLIGLGLLILGLFLGRSGLWISAAGSIAALWSFVQVSHVSPRENLLLDISLLLHLIAVGFWIGILIPLKRLAAVEATWAEAADLGHRFGILARFMIPLLIAAGVYMSYALVGSFKSLVGTAYGQALVMKVLLVTGLLALGAANKLRFIPALQAQNPQAAGHLSKSISVEWAVILAVIGTTAVLTSNLTLPT